MVRFKAKTFKTGNSDVVAVPSAYIRNGLVKREQEYWFELKEVDTNGLLCKKGEGKQDN